MTDAQYKARMVVYCKKVSNPLVISSSRWTTFALGYCSLSGFGVKAMIYIFKVLGLAGLFFYMSGCDKSVNEAPVTFKRSVYVPHLTIMPDTVLVNDTFALKASVYLANGCQVFDSLGIQRTNQTVRLTYRKKEFQNKDFNCNPRETFIKEIRTFSFSQPGQYAFAFVDSNGTVAKRQSVRVSADTPDQNFEWQLRLKNADIPESTLDQLMVTYRERRNNVLPDAPGPDTIFRNEMKRVNDTLYRVIKNSVLIDSMQADSLAYTFRIGEKPAMADTFSALINDNTIYKGQTEVIRKGPSPIDP